MPDPFTDAQAWYDRAQHHIREYRVLSSRPIWAICQEQEDGGALNYTLRLHRHLLTQLKPVAGEVANALFQSLDNIIGVAARQAGVDRSPQISWPWKIEPDPTSPLPGAVLPAIGEKLNNLGRRGLPQPWIRLIEETFATPPINLPHIDVVKEVSLSGKHWELVPTDADALAVAWAPSGSNTQAIVNIPTDHFKQSDEFLFHKGEKISAALQIVISMKLVAESKDFQPEPIFAFEATSRFVATALEKARQLGA